jgi:CelD/BcsL family acetyltransferase involved in cellulose biosynthesis
LIRGILERRVIEPGGVAQLAPAWRELTERRARSPFESPAWLLPWLRHYGSAWQPRVVTWWRSGELVAVAPVAWRHRRRRGIPYRELTFWGRTETPLRGWVDVVADADVAVEVGADFTAWLEAPDQEWDLFNYLHLDPDSPTLATLSARTRSWWRVDLSSVLHSLEYVVALPEDASSWHGQLGPKARHEIRREMRQFERQLYGRIEEVHEPAASDEIVHTLESLMADRWGEREAYFPPDPRFRSFVRDAAQEAFDAGVGWALVARDPERTAACLFVLTLGRTAVAVLIGVSQAPQYRSMSLGKCLMNRAIEGAVARGCRKFSFLTENGYKTVFWHAEGQPTESGFLGRGPIGRAIAAYATARQVPDRLRRPFAARRREYRP